LIGNASYRKQRAPGTLSSRIDAVNGEVKRDFDINPYSYALNTSRALDPDEFYTRNYAPFNIIHELENNYIDIDVTNLRFNGELKYKPFRQLELSVLGAVKYSATARKHNILDGSNQAEAYRANYTTSIRDGNSYLYPDPDDPFSLPEVILPTGGIYERTDNSMFGWDFRTTASYNDTFARDHTVNLYGGMETNSIDREANWFRGWGMQYDFGEVANYDFRIFKRGAEDGTEYFTMSHKHDRRVAFFGTGTYSYKGRYSLNGTIRYEGSNQLGKSRQSRWLPTWNVSGKWNIIDEPWMQGLQPGLSHAAVKASYSLTAERGPVSNALVIVRANTPWRNSAMDSETVLEITSLGNSNLTYEKKHELNIGLELGFLNNRINFTGDWYKRNNFDLIGPAYTYGAGGQVTKSGNVAAMKSDGFELSLTTNNIQSRDFSWTTNVIYSHTHNIVTKLLSTRRVIDLVSGTGFAMEGYPNHSIFSIPFRGLNDEGLPTFLDQDGNVTTTGIYFQTANPEQMDFLEFSGTADPTDVASLGNTFRWKGFKLNVFITGSFGNVIRLDPVFRARYNDLRSMPKEFRDRWVVPGDENVTTIPVIASRIQNKNDSHLSYAYNAYNYSTERIASGDFIRLKEISLLYDLPARWARAISCNSLSLKLQATNLFLLYADSKLNGQDPEFFNTGGVAVPMAKQFTLTLKVGLGGSSAKKAAPVSTYVPAPEIREKIVEKEVEKVVEKEVIKEVVKEVPAATLKGTYADDLFFVIGKAELNPKEAFKLGRICQILKDNPEAKIVISGYADSGTGNSRINEELSRERAHVVADMLREAGISGDRIRVENHGGDRNPSAAPETNRVAVCIVE
jgi:outer membrane protein OmpA-like peptidoglycan-associated protein